MKFPHLLVLPVAITAFVSCTSIQTDTVTSAKIKQGVPGGEVVTTSTIQATVTHIDSARRKIALTTRNGEKLNVTAGPEVVNFPQIRIGDQLKVTLTEEVVIRMAKPGEKLKDDGMAVVELAPVGAKPALRTTETNQIIATITAIDAKKRKATLQFADGSSKKITVREDVDLTQRKVGEKVVIRTSEIFAIRIDKP